MGIHEQLFHQSHGHHSEKPLERPHAAAKAEMELPNAAESAFIEPPDLQMMTMSCSTDAGEDLGIDL
jgi:hypothetical protein